MKVSRGKHEPGCRETQQTPFEWTGLKWLHSGTRGCARMVLCDGARGNGGARMRFPTWISGWAHKTRCQGTPQGPGRPVSTALWRVAFGRPLPGPPQSTLESGVRAIFFYFLSSAHRAPNETRQSSVEAVIRDPTRTSGHHFPGSHSKIHVGKEMWYAIAPLRAGTLLQKKIRLWG